MFGCRQTLFFMKRVALCSSLIIYRHLYYLSTIYGIAMRVLNIIILYIVVVHLIFLLISYYILAFFHSFFFVQNKSKTFNILLVCCLCISDLKLDSSTYSISFLRVNSSAFFTFCSLDTECPR